MIVEKKKQPEIKKIEPEAYKEAVKAVETPGTMEDVFKANALIESYRAVRKILEGIHVNPDDPNSPRLFRTIKLDNGQVMRLKNNKHNMQSAIALPAVFIHFINVYYNVEQSRISEGKGIMRLHYVLNTLNINDDDAEETGMKVFQLINDAINAHKAEFPALVNRFQLKYWEQPLTFDDGMQPYWIDYQIWFNEFSSYQYKDYVETHIVIPPFTNHSDQDPINNPNNHPDHKTPTPEDACQFKKTL